MTDVMTILRLERPDEDIATVGALDDAPALMLAGGPRNPTLPADGAGCIGRISAFATRHGRPSPNR